MVTERWELPEYPESEEEWKHEEDKLKREQGKQGEREIRVLLHFNPVESWIIDKKGIDCSDDELTLCIAYQLYDDEWKKEWFRRE